MRNLTAVNALPLAALSIVRTHRAISPDDRAPLTHSHDSGVLKRDGFASIHRLWLAALLVLPLVVPMLLSGSPRHRTDSGQAPVRHARAQQAPARQAPVRQARARQAPADSRGNAMDPGGAAGKDAYRPRVTADQAKAKGLPAVGFTFTLRQGGWTMTPLPEPGCYLRLSGPPGGPLAIEIWDFPNPKASGSTLVRWVTNHFKAPRHGPLRLTTQTTFPLLGAPRPALALGTGKSLGRTAWCAVLASSPPPRVQEFVVLFGHGLGERSKALGCAQIAGHQAIAPALHSLRALQ